LIITHWGEDRSADLDGLPVSAAERLLTTMRAEDVRCPVIIFSSTRNMNRRKQIALGLGAQAYCYTFEGLYQAIERVLAPAKDVG
jgi:hypothetical protein